MALKHVAHYWAMVTGNTVKEEMAVLKAREKGSYEELFGLKDTFRKKIESGGKRNEWRR